MPLYEYKCEDCKKSSEVKHTLDEKLEKCPKCESKRIRKVFFPVLVIYRGKGFYSNGG